ncbi:3-ketodihydrosphingosine reductase [Atheta coriaria]|uniref:3-ketodihydrosphingosine reductase n=1 Tax=Dalotia coriaria TaxID=877792 RepID=UPI0031F3FC1A
MLFIMLLPVLLVTFLLKLYKDSITPKKTLRGKHICITGGSSGIGKSLAVLASQQGAHVTIIARNSTRLSAAILEISSERSSDEQEFVTVSLDCTDTNATHAKIKEIDDKRPIYMFVNCAGFATCGIFEEMTQADIKNLFDINYFATVNTLQALVPRMKQRKDGIVVITGSQGGLMGIYGYSIYASAKFALRGLAEVLKMELDCYNVSVTLSLPPDTDTPGFETENLTKPKETKLISEAAGLVDPQVVAQALLNDALNGKFFSSVGFESWLMTTLCVGMTPFQRYFDVIVQALTLGPIRLISSFYITNFQKIVIKCKEEREGAKDK